MPKLPLHYHESLKELSTSPQPEVDRTVFSCKIAGSKPAECQVSVTWATFTTELPE